jgi:hypothetical protein
MAKTVPKPIRIPYPSPCVNGVIDGIFLYKMWMSKVKYNVYLTHPRIRRRRRR